MTMTVNFQFDGLAKFRKFSLTFVILNDLFKIADL